MRCWACGDIVHEALECAVCSHFFHAGCLSEEGEDGHLCRECSTECPDCSVPIILDDHKSNHLIPCAYGGQGVVCPDYAPDRFKPTHTPQVFACFPRAEVDRIRAEIIRCTQGRAGVFHVSGLEHVATILNRRLAPILDCIPATETYKFRVRPELSDGIDLHMDLHYILEHVSDPHRCIHCGGTVHGGQPGIHWTKKCRRVPKTARAFTIAGNLGPEPISFLSFGPPCAVARSTSGAIIPVVSGSTQTVPCILAPGEVVVFSSHLLHRSTPGALLNNRWSFDVRVAFLE
jgi:ferredoxin